MSQSELEGLMAWNIRAAHLPPPEREWLFAASLGRKWRFDFAWPDLMLALEVEGGTFINGGHNRGTGYEKDVEKYNAATILGWRVLRATKHMIEDGRALTTLLAALPAREGQV